MSEGVLWARGTPDLIEKARGMIATWRKKGGSIEERCIEWMDSDDMDIARAAIRSLGTQGAPPGIPHLLSVLNGSTASSSTSRPLRGDAALALLGHSRAGLAELQSVLRDDADRDRIAAGMLESSRLGCDALPLLWDAVQECSEKVRALTLYRLLLCREAPVPLLVSALDLPDATMFVEPTASRSGQSSLHREALWQLAELGRGAQDAIPALEGLLEMGTRFRWLTRAALVAVGGGLAPPVDVPAGIQPDATGTLERFYSVHDEVREGALRDISACGEACCALYPALVEGLLDPAFGDCDRVPLPGGESTGDHFRDREYHREPSLACEIPDVLVATAPGEDAVITALEACLEASDEDLQASAATALGDLGAPARRAAPKILSVLEAALREAEAHPDARHGRFGMYWDARVHLAHVVAKLGPDVPGVSAALRRAVHSPVLYIQRVAIEALEETPADDVEAVKILIEVLHGTDEPSYWAQSALLRFGEHAVPELLKALHSPDRAVRIEAARTLAEVGDAKTVAPALVELLGDTSSEVREKTIWILRDQDRLWQPGLIEMRAVPLLLEALDDPSASLRQHAAYLLGDLEDRAAAAIPALLRMLEREPDVRDMAIWALAGAGRGSRSAMAALIDRLRDESDACAADSRHPIWMAAQAALVRLLPESIPLLEAALAGAGPGLRGRITQTLAWAREVRGERPRPTPEAFAEMFESLGGNSQGYPEYVHRKTGIVFVRLPGGTFFMGSPSDDPLANNSECPRHEVRLASFLIAKHEVTWSDWRQFMPSSEEGEWKTEWNVLPAKIGSCCGCDSEERFSTFCERTGLLLPTEAQWEYACRAGSDEPSPRDLDAQAWHAGNSDGSSHAVGEKAPNAFGLHDMLGNISEWVRDGGSYERPCLPGDGYRQPASRQVFRGGSYKDPAEELRSTRRRAFYGGDDWGRAIGLRPVFYPLP